MSDPSAIGDGRAAHLAWERKRTRGNECADERDIAERAKRAGADMVLWWRGWFERSDEWRDQIEQAETSDAE